MRAMSIDLILLFSIVLQPHQRMDRNQTMPNIRKPYENNYTKTYEGSTWRGAQDGQNGNVNERYGQKPAPRFQGNANPQFNGHQGEVVQNGNDGKPRQPRPNGQYQNHQNRQNGAYVPRNNNPAVNGAHQPQYAVNPANGYQGNRGKTEVSDNQIVISIRVWKRTQK